MIAREVPVNLGDYRGANSVRGSVSQEMYFAMLKLAVLLGLATQRCSALVPMSCTDAVSLGSRTCCPTFWGDDSPCGQASDRGQCATFPQPDGARGSRDFRAFWPTHLFSFMCECKGNFWGADCGECRPGLAGRWCDRAVPPVHRPDCSSLSPAGRRRLISAFQLAKTSYSDRWTIYRRVGRNMHFRRASLFDSAVVWSHYITASPPPGRRIRYAHESLAFLSWHRMHLFWFERELRNLTGDPQLAVCYWKWSGKRTCDICTPDFFGANDARTGFLVGNFANWTAICAGPLSNDPSLNSGCPETRGVRIERFVRLNPSSEEGLPTDQDVTQCLQIQAFDTFPYNQESNNSFRNALEGFRTPFSDVPNLMHNRIHVFLGGFMLSFYTTTTDPIFLPVHCEVDRIFEMWLERRGRSNVYPRHRAIVEGHRWNDYILPFLPLHTNEKMLDPTSTLGYTYRRPPQK